jgi:hypothetical protein
MSWGFELFLNLGFSGGGGCPGMSKAPVRSACLGMLADIARPESNGEVTNGIFLAIFLGRLQALVTLVAAAIRPEIEKHSTSSLIQSLAEPQRDGQSLSVGYIAGSRTPRCSGSASASSPTAQLVCARLRFCYSCWTSRSSFDLFSRQ